MPIELRYYPEDEYLVATLKSPVTTAEFRESMETILNSEQYPPDVRTIWNGQKLDFHQITRGFQERIVEIRCEYPERGKAQLAFVVADDLGFGMARMYEILSEGLPQESRVFRSLEEGQKWLVRDQ